MKLVYVIELYLLDNNLFEITFTDGVKSTYKGLVIKVTNKKKGFEVVFTPIGNQPFQEKL